MVGPQAPFGLRGALKARRTPVAPRYRTLKQLIASNTVIPTILYGRVSSEPQLFGHGLKRQSSGHLNWIAKHPEINIRVDRTLEDQARSAWRADHIYRDDAALGKLVAMVESGELRPPLLIIVEALDRLSRENPWIAHGRLSSLVGRGIFVATVADDRIYHLHSDLADLIISVILCCAANKSSEDTSQRVRDIKLLHVQESMISKALIHANVPAWLVTPDKISKTNRLTRKAPLIPRHGETILAMYQMALHHGSDHITRRLIADGVEPFGRSGKWSLRTVKKILRSRSVLGHLETKHGIIEGIYDRIPGLTDDLWLQAQAAQDRRRDAGSASPWQSKRVNLLAGIASCAACGSKMRLTTNDKTGLSYYGCRNRALRGKSECENRCRYRQDVIEQAMLDTFGLGWLQAGAKTKAPVDIKALEAEIVKLRDRAKRLASKLQELDSDEMADLVLTQLRDLRRKISDAETRLQAARQQVAAAKPIRISDTTDRAMIASVLKQQLISATFEDHHYVSLTTAGGYVLMLVARANGELVKSACLERIPKPDIAQHPDEDWLQTKQSA
jgi:DNA invertase Pin-like site-specific DNA recombinase